MLILEFLLTPWIFILLLVAGVVFQVITVQMERFGWTTVLVSAVLFLLHLKYDLLTFVINNPGQTVLYVLGFFGVGVLWSMGKWYFNSLKKLRLIREAKAAYLAKPKSKADDYSAMGKFMKKYLTDKTSKSPWYDSTTVTKEELENSVREFMPKAAEKKSLIVAWISFWPFSVVGTFLNDPVRRFANEIYNRISGVYEKISNSMANSAVNEI